jgi:hypothetical protein
VGALEDTRHFFSDALQAAADGGFRRPRRLKLRHQLTGAPHVGVNGQAVIAAQRDRKLDLAHGRQRIVRQRGQRRGDFLEDCVLF